MKKFTVFLICICSLLTSNAQNKAERRIYLWDVTKSLETNGIWKEVKHNLVNAINQIDDTLTEIVVVPFVEEIVDVWNYHATDKGKDILISKIESIEPGGKLTNICAALQRFHYLIDDSKINYMFLMTDGVHNASPFSELIKNIQLWNEKTDTKDVYGFYVMLHHDAQNTEIERAIKSQKNLWVVKSANINVNLYRLPSQIIYNIRNDKEMSLNVTGIVDRAGEANVVFNLKNNKYFELHIKQQSIKNGYVSFSLNRKLNLSEIPEMINLTIDVKCENEPEFTYLLPSQIRILVKNEKEHALRISIK